MSYDIWDGKPILVNGNWLHRRGRQSPKRYYSYETISSHAAEVLVVTLPEPGELVCVTHPPE